MKCLSVCPHLAVVSPSTDVAGSLVPLGHPSPTCDETNQPPTHSPNSLTQTIHHTQRSSSVADEQPSA